MYDSHILKSVRVCSGNHPAKINSHLAWGHDQDDSQDHLKYLQNNALIQTAVRKTLCSASWDTGIGHNQVVGMLGLDITAH